MNFSYGWAAVCLSLILIAEKVQASGLDDDDDDENYATLNFQQLVVPGVTDVCLQHIRNEAQQCVLTVISSLGPQKSEHEEYSCEWMTEIFKTVETNCPVRDLINGRVLECSLDDGHHFSVWFYETLNHALVNKGCVQRLRYEPSGSDRTAEDDEEEDESDEDHDPHYEEYHEEF